jgi:hypothetical protein
VSWASSVPALAGRSNLQSQPGEAASVLCPVPLKASPFHVFAERILTADCSAGIGRVEFPRRERVCGGLPLESVPRIGIAFIVKPLPEKVLSREVFAGCGLNARRPNKAGILPLQSAIDRPPQNPRPLGL